MKLIHIYDFTSSQDLTHFIGSKPTFSPHISVSISEIGTYCTEAKWSNWQQSVSFLITGTLNNSVPHVDCLRIKELR